MAIFKTAQLEITPQSVHTTNLMKSDELMEQLLLKSGAAKTDEEIRQRFLKFSQNLKRVAPKAKDFLYFSAIMLHSAEAALIDYKTGKIKKDTSGHDVTAE